MRRRPARRIAAAASVAALAAAGISTATATASSAAASDSFYGYSGSAPLSSYAPGTVLKTRTLQYHVVGIPTPVTAIQILYRTPTVPGYIAQGNGGVLEGTFSDPQGIGTGDGVMVGGDVRALARQYCATGDGSIKYDQFDLLSHTGTAAPWAPLALAWLNDRFAGRTAPSDCGSIAAGNSLAPEQAVPAS